MVERQNAKRIAEEEVWGTLISITPPRWRQTVGSVSAPGAGRGRGDDAEVA